MNARPPEIDMALICEEAGISPAELNRLADELARPVTCMSLSRLFPGIERNIILGLISVGCRANAFDRAANRKLAFDSQSWNIRPREFRSLISRATVISGAIPYFREMIESPDSYRVAATIPESLTSLHPFYGVFENTALGMRRLIEEASREVYIVSPFFSREGIKAIAPAVQLALTRGIRVVVLARCLSQGEQNRRALESLLEIAKKTPGKLSLIESEGENGSPLLHAKILARDDGEEVYVGSANLTGAGMDRTLEVGVFLKGDRSRDIVKLIKELATLSEAK